MKIQKINPTLLLIIMIVLLFSGCKSNHSSSENAVFEDTVTDAYDILRNPAKMQQQTNEDLSGNVIVLSEEDFIERITNLNNPKGFQYKGKTPCIVALYTLRCRPSSFQSTILNNLAPEYKGKVIFYKIDLDRAREVAFQFKVKDTPMIIYFKPRGTISTTKGYLNLKELRNAIDKYLLNP
jgi:thioredoxin-like negative regulator of GroEL